MRVLGIGLLVSVSGMALDVYWHSIGIADDAYPVFPAHIILIAGLLIAAEGARRAYKDSTGRRQTTLAITAVAAAAAGLSRGYDEILHLQDIDNSTQNMIAHLIGLIGLLALIIGTIVAWRLEGRKQTSRPSTAD